MFDTSIFISHSHEDIEFARKFANDLTLGGAKVWMDDINMQHGNFLEQINEALRKCNWLILIQTPHALRSVAVRNEVNAAIFLSWQSKIKGVIPVIAEKCDSAEVPATWLTLQYYDATNGYQRALTNVLSVVGLTNIKKRTISANYLLTERLKEHGYKGLQIGDTEIIVPPTCYIPEGVSTPYLSSVGAKKGVYLKGFHMNKYPITVAEYLCAVRAKSVRIPPEAVGMNWERQIASIENPVVCVSWEDALLYTKWITDITGEDWEMPTEFEWIKSASGPDTWDLPWVKTGEREIHSILLGRIFILAGQQKLPL